MPTFRSAEIPVDLRSMNQHLIQMDGKLVGMFLDNDPMKRSLARDGLDYEMIPRNMRELSEERRKKYGKPLPLTSFHYVLLEAMRVPDGIMSRLIHHQNINSQTNPFSKIVSVDNLAGVILSLRSEGAIAEYLYNIYSEMYQYTVDLIRKLIPNQESFNETRRLERE